MKAYEIIEKYGWVQREEGDTKHGFCARGALAYAYSGVRFGSQSFAYAVLTATYFQLRYYLKQTTGNPDIIRWNDTPGRTKDEVIAVLRHVEDSVESPTSRWLHHPTI